MARYYRRRYRTITRAPKKKWCSNMIPVEIQNNAVNQGTQDNPQWTLAVGTTLAVNKTETNSPTPVVVKTGNFRAQFDLIATGVLQTSDMTMFIIYIPEGIAPVGALAVKDIMVKHPEWIIAWKKLDLEYNSTTTATTANQRITMSSRLKRNLNSGDRIDVYLFSTLDTSQNATVAIRGMCQFWTCAN